MEVQGPRPELGHSVASQTGLGISLMPPRCYPLLLPWSRVSLMPLALRGMRPSAMKGPQLR